MGWLVDYLGRLMMDYGWSEGFVLYELPMIRGWIYYAYAIENSGWLQFSGVHRKGKGYIAQERDRLMDIAVRQFGWNKTNGT